MSSELSGQKTELPGETGTGTGADDPGRAIAGQNITMSRRELRALSDAGSGAAHGDTAGGAADTGSPARAEGIGADGQDGGPAAEGSADLAGSRTVIGSADGVTAADVSDVGEGQPESGVVPDHEPEGTGADGGQGPAPAAEVIPGPGVPGAGDSGFPRQPRTDTPVAGDGGQNGAVGGRVADDSDDSFGRGAGSHDLGAGEPGGQDSDEHSGPDSRPSADFSQSARQGEGNIGEKAADGRDGDFQAQRPKDQVHVQQPAPDAGTDQPGEAAAESAPDQQPDDLRVTAMERQMERMLATVEAMQEKLEASEAKHEEDKAGLEQKLGDLQAENLELKQKVVELEAGQRDRQAVPDHLPESPGEQPSSGDRDVAEPLVRPDVRSPEDDPDAADLINAASAEADKEARKAPEIAERPAFSEETRDAATAAAGLGGTIGLLNPAVGLVVGADSARRAYEKMPPEEQYDAMRMADTAMAALGSMSPGTAVAAVTLSAMIPTLQDGFRNMYDKLRRKD